MSDMKMGPNYIGLCPSKLAHIAKITNTAELWFVDISNINTHNLIAENIGFE